MVGHPAAPAPPPVPGIVPGIDKRYGSPIPLVLGRGVVAGQKVYQGSPVSGAGQVWNGVIWQAVATGMLGIDVVLALCEAPVTSVVRCYRRVGTSQISIAVADLVNRITLSDGSVEIITAATATAWSKYVGTASEGLAHSGTCHVRIHKAALREDGSFPDTRWEVQSSACVTSASTPDAEAAEILLYLLTDTVHGLGFSTSLVNVDTGIDGSAASSFRRYTRARGWHLSRVIEQGEKIADVIDQLLLATNSTVIWVDGVLTAVPLDDEASSATSAWPGHATYPYTPVTSSTAVGDDDFASGNEDPVRVTRQPRSAIYSVWPLDYTLRKDDSGNITYAVNHAEYQSDVWSSANNLRRAEMLDLTPWIMGESHAWFVSYLTAQRSMYHRSRYTFPVKPRLTRLAPGDFIDLTDSILGISGVSCRVETAEEDEDGVIEISALEWPLGTTKAFSLPTTSPGGRQAAGAARPLASSDLANVPDGSSDLAKMSPGIYDRDNLAPNPSSEIAPPSGADATKPEWADRANAGGGAYSGSWVREITPLATPVNATFTAGAGTLTTGTYYYRVSALKVDRETLASTETSLAITGPAGVNVNWGVVTGATGYRIYGRSTGAELLLATVGAVTTWLDNGSLTPSGALPAANTTGFNGFWVPCSPGAMFYAEAQAKRTSGTGSGGRMNIGFYPTLGSFTGGTVTSGAYSTSGSWAKVTVTSAAAPAGTNAAYISYEAAAGDTIQFDALYARRVVADAVLDNTLTTATAGTDWSLTTNTIRRAAGIVTLRIAATAGATSAWTSVCTLPADCRPALDLVLLGMVRDSSTTLAYFATVYITASTGVVQISGYDNGTSVVGPVFAIGTGDTLDWTATFSIY